MPQPFVHAQVRWQIRRTMLERERKQVQVRLQAMPAPAQRQVLEERLRDLERDLRQLGPDPGAKMG